MTVADQAVRDRALDIGGSFAVAAPAGSGKTGLLIRRILRLLAVCDHPEQVLALTFTRKAAAEMEERIVQALNLARTDSPPGDDYLRGIWEDARKALARDREQNWNLVAAPSRLRIMTIDSLCRDLARQLAVETALGELPEATEQPEFFYREAIRQFLRQLENPGPLADALADLLSHLDNNLASLERLLENLLARREQWLGPLLKTDTRGVLEQVLENTIEETLSATGAALAPVGSELAMLADYAATNLSQTKPDHSLCTLAGIAALPGTEPTAENLDAWLTLSTLLLTNQHQWRRGGIDKRLGFPQKKESVDPGNADSRKAQLLDVLERCRAEPGLLELITDLRHLPPPAYRAEQWQLLKALTLILPSLVAQLSVLFRESHACDFTEITLAAHNALGDEDNPSDLSLRLDYRIQHILVDEFQDTASVQFDLLRKLTWGWQPDDGRTLFIVGDGMQSLYGFRNANVGLFLEARKAPVGAISLEPLDLEVNFRSDTSIVDWVNRTFVDVFPRTENISRGAVSYSPALAARQGLPAAGVSVDIFAEDTGAGEEAARVIELIDAARRRDPEGTIAVLAYRRSHLAAIFKALVDNDIPWEATDIDPLSSRMAVIDLVSLTRALLNPADRIAWLAVLRAPWCGFSLADLHAIAHFGEETLSVGRPLPWLAGQLWRDGLEQALSDDGRQRLVRVGPILRAAWNNRHRKPLRQWVEGTWIALGGPAALVDDNRIPWCRQYLDLLEKHSDGAGLGDMTLFQAAVDRLFAQPVTGGANPVQVLTIHKSKGLEFDTVILPGLHRGMKGGDSSLLYWRERIDPSGDNGLIISPPLSDEGRNDSGDRLVAHLRYEEKIKSGLEDGRVLYVACTRAIKRLHLLFNSPKNGPAAGSLLTSLWSAIENGEDFRGAELRRHDLPLADTRAPETDDTGDGTIRSEIFRLPCSWRHPCADSPKTIEPAPGKVSTGVEDDGMARHTGTVLHRTLKRIVDDGLAAWGEKRIREQTRAWAIQLRQLGLDDTEGQVEILRRALTAMLADAKGRWILDSNHSASACELPLDYSGDTGAGQIVIDRTFIDETGVRWIIDYKSSSPGEGQGLEAFYRQEAEKYREQLAIYRDILAALEDRETRTALYFPLVPGLHQLR